MGTDPDVRCTGASLMAADGKGMGASSILVIFLD